MLRKTSHCLNCEQPVEHDFCPYCGQENKDLRTSFRPLIGDLFEELFQLESRIWRTLRALVAQPGRLTIEYNAGRRVRWTSPLRLYLLASVAYFFVAAWRPPADIGNPKGKAPSEAELVQSREAIKQQPRWMRQFLEHALELERAGPREANRRLWQALMTTVPKAMVLLLPLFALLMKLCYPRRLYVEHLIFALHTHALAFGALLLATLLPYEWPSFVLLFGTAAYWLVAQKRVYEGSWRRTLLKATAVGTLYFVVLGLAIMGSVLVALIQA